MKFDGGLTWGFALAVLVLGSQGLPAAAATLEEQMNILPHNATEGQARDVADQWVQLGQQQAAANQNEQAIASWQQAVEIYHALGDTVAEGLTYDRIGMVYIDLGRLDRADPVLRRRLAIARGNRDISGVVYGLNNVGTLLIQQKRLSEAKAAFEEGYQIASSIDFPKGVGLSLSNLGLIASLENNLTAAATYYEAATNYRFRAGDHLGEANSSNNLGDVYRALHRNGEATGAYGVALSIGEELGNRALQLRALDGFIAIYLERGELRSVQDYLDKRIALTLNGQPDAQTVQTLSWLGQYYEQSGNLSAAQETYQRALVLARSLGQRSQEISLDNRLINFR